LLGTYIFNMEIEEFFKRHDELQKKYGICNDNDCIINVIYEGIGKRKNCNAVKYAKCNKHGIIDSKVWEKYMTESNELYYELNGRPTLINKNDN